MIEGAAGSGTAEGPWVIEDLRAWLVDPLGGWYGLRRGYRGRFGMYLPPLLEHLGLVELTHGARNNQVRAAPQP